jgi:hypothetical protein
MRLGGQLRVGPRLVIGWDMGAALALGRALGISARAIAELLPEIEEPMAQKTNQKIKAGGAADGD